MKYNNSIKKEVLNLLVAGLPITQIAKKYNIPRQTIYQWHKKHAKNSADTTSAIINLKKQIHTLSTQKPTTAITRRIAELTNALAKLERINKKEQNIKSNKKVKIIDNIKTAELKKFMLDPAYGLYTYQKNFIKDGSRFRLWLKSRQIGATYGCAGEALIDAMGGLDQLVISASEEQALKWTQEIYKHAEKLEIELSGAENKIKTPAGTFIYIFANNFRTIQGFSGSVWLDEFAWYINPKRIWNAFIPSITSVKSGQTKARITILSTPFEEQSLFHQLVTNETKYYMFSRHSTDIYQAVKQGLQVDIQVLKDLFDAESWAAMYECQFVDDDLAFFPISLIKSCVDDKLEYQNINKKHITYAGYDIGRIKDLSVLAALQAEITRGHVPLPSDGLTRGHVPLPSDGLTRGHVPLPEKHYVLKLLNEYKKASFANQQHELKTFLKTYHKAHLNMDCTGIGMNLTEDLTQSAPDQVTGIYFTANSKEAMVLNLKKMLEDKVLKLPNDPNLIADIHAIKRKAGARQFLYDADKKTTGHADRFWALALAAKQLDYLDESIGGSTGGACIF